jgi:hypothetical protein
VVHALNDWVLKDKFLLYVHPPSWRKPEHYLWKILSNKQILYLKSYSKKEGDKVFGCSTLFDYYLLENTEVYNDTIIDCQDKHTYNVRLDQWEFLPSGRIDTIANLLGNGNNVVLYSRTMYGTDKKNVSMKPSNTFHLPIVHNMTKKQGLGFVYSNEDKGHFGIPKVILSFGEFQYPYNDWKGEYGMSQICYGLPITSQEEGEMICKAINSNTFKEILKYTKWSTFQTDWRMFKYFKPDFWKHLIDDE